MLDNVQPMVLARYGEISLKGQNRRVFEQQIIKNLAYRLKEIGHYKVYMQMSRIWIEVGDELTGPELERAMRAALDVATTTFGLVSASPVYRFPGDFEKIVEVSKMVVGERLASATASKPMRFKVETRRGNKQFPMDSPEISRELGHELLVHFGDRLTVDVQHPDFILYVEVREENSVYVDIIPAYKGLPTGTGGKALMLLSGGIDSPVALFRLASRGVTFEAIYFHTFPYTSDQAKQKVLDLASILSKSCGRILLHVVDFTDIQLDINQAAPPEMLTIVMRRFMMRIAEAVAEERDIQVLATGESLGQVASQTMHGLSESSAVVDRPILRPLIAMDKNETIDLARKIGTFEISTLPYDDCCTVFVAKHPKTRPTAEDSRQAESSLDIEGLTQQGLERIETFDVRPEAQHSLGNFLSRRRALVKEAGEVEKME